MKTTKENWMNFRHGLMLGLVCLAIAAGTAMAQKPSAPPAPKKGILLMAHGGSAAWNAEVNKVAAQVNQTVPVEVAFGMATKRTLQAGIDNLVARGVTEIVAVPLFVSSHSSVIASTQYLLGQRPDAPADLALFATMDHGGYGAQGGSEHGGGHNMMMMSPASDPAKPVKSPVPIRMTGALDRHALVADILLDRARAISKDPAHEVVILVAHGPVPDDDNRLWLGDMGALAQRMQTASSYQRIEYLTVRDDADEPLRNQAAEEFRTVVKKARGENNRVLIVPVLLSFGGIEAGVRDRLQGLDYTMASQALLPDDRLAKWVLSMAGMETGARVAPSH
jgi:sirohydrochlorin ferrochelatase